MNCGINPLAALAGIENGVLPRTPVFSFAVTTAVEVARVARAAGIALDPGEDHWAGQLRCVCDESAANRCSMLEDLRANRRTEIDSLCLAVSAAGGARGVATPCNDLLGRIVRAVSARGGGFPQ
ncbi:MAG: hypothetical protein L0Z55_04955 [Planctomycetes bacterium]|nr:hypothetical protein [Planctomycetota bacterium]